MGTLDRLCLVIHRKEVAVPWAWGWSLSRTENASCFKAPWSITTERGAARLSSCLEPGLLPRNRPQPGSRRRRGWPEVTGEQDCPFPVGGFTPLRLSPLWLLPGLTPDLPKRLPLSLKRLSIVGQEAVLYGRNSVKKWRDLVSVPALPLAKFMAWAVASGTFLHFKNEVMSPPHRLL